MRKFTILAIAGLMSMLTAAAQDVTYLDPATLVEPAGLLVGMAPMSVDITWNNQEFKLVSPKTDDFGDKYVTAYVALGEEEPQEVQAYVMYSYGNEADPNDPDLWMLEIALWGLDDLWDFDGNTITVSVPEGVVSVRSGAVNPSQSFVFEIVPTFTSYTITPESGSTLAKDERVITIGFDGNPVEYLQSAVKLLTYEPSYREIALKFGKEVTVTENNELSIDLSAFGEGDYELVVPEGFLKITVDEEVYLCPNMWLEYTLSNESGVEFVSAVKEGRDIYNLQGIRVIKGATPEQIRNLGKGVYIIDGKKVIR